MSNQELKELARVLDGIAEGEEWELEWGATPSEWHSSSHEQDPVWLVGHGYNIRLKPQPPPPDPYTELKAAHAAGKVIQSSLGDNWYACIPNWRYPVHEYRIKPELQKVPLGPEDVPPGSVLRVQEGGWKMIIGATPEGVNTLDHGLINYGLIQDNIWQIKRPGEDWQPCWKEVEV